MSGIHDAEMLRTVLEAMQTGVCVVDLQGKILFWNDGAERITGFLRHEVMGRSFKETFEVRCHHRDCDLCEDRCPMIRAMHAARPVEANGSLHHKAGHRTLVHVWAVPVRDEHGSIIGAVESFDCQRSSSASGKFREGDHTWMDEATGVANHAMMQAHLREALATCTDMQVPFALICVRLDELKQLHAKYGQKAACSVLRVVAHGLEDTLRPTDFVGRWSEDQFLGILTGCSEVGVSAVGKRVREMIAGGSIEWWGEQVFAGPVSLGSVVPVTGDTVETLVARVQQSLAGQGIQVHAAAAGSSGEAPKS